MSAADQPTLAMTLLRSRIKGSLRQFLQTEAASGGNYGQAALDCSATLAEEMAELLGALADPATRYGAVLQILSTLPGAVEDAHDKAVDAARRKASLQ